MKNTLLIFLLILAPQILLAQSSGRWVESYSLPKWRIINFDFSDSSHGIILVDSGGLDKPAALRTTDAGRNWTVVDLSRLSDSMGGAQFIPWWSFQALDSENAYDVSTDLPGSMIVTHDGGVTWEFIRNAFSPPSDGFDFRMFTPARGVAMTSSLWYEWSTADSGRLWHTSGNGPGASFEDAIFLDTSEFWVSYGNGIMAHTTDAARTWNPDTVLDSVPGHYYLAPFVQTHDKGRFYAVFNWMGSMSTATPPPLHDDFVETTDDGASWRVDSTLDSAMIYRMSSPSPGTLWALTNPIYALNFGFYGARSVSVSSDDGHTWDLDSSLLGDTLTGMRWPDAMHGYITASKSGGLVVYRFVTSSSDVVSAAPSSVELQIYPNPAVSTITVHSVTQTHVHLFDVLGREVLAGTVSGNGTLALDVSKLPRGVYEVLVERNSLRQTGSVTLE